MTSKRQQRRTVLQQLLGVAFKVAEENRRLRAALEFYADADNWRADDWGVQGVIETPAYGKPTEIASKALGFRATYVARPPSRRRRCWEAIWRFLKPRRVTRLFRG